MASGELVKTVNGYENYITKRGTDEKAIEAYIQACEVALLGEKDKEYGLALTKRAKELIENYVRYKTGGGNVYALEIYCTNNGAQYKIINEYYKVLEYEAPYLVDSFFRYIEAYEKDVYKRFYFPRIKVLAPMIEAYQQIYDHELDFLSVSQPKRTGKTTSGLKLTQMIAGRNPDGSCFAVGKGEGLVKRFYGGLISSFENKDEYERYITVFPTAKKAGTRYARADDMTIDLHTYRTFSTITCRPIDGQIVGSTEANELLYIDDCVKNHEEARNRDRLEFLCEKVTDDVLGRRIEGTPIIIQGTKYSLYDPITMLQEKARDMDWRWKEIAIPALDEITDESNWEIIGQNRKKLFTTAYFKNERKLVTDETWEAEFQQQPFEAKGRMFPAERLNRFVELPVDVEPDAVMAVCDSADKGDDYCAMPIAYIYGDNIFIVDVVFDDSGTEFTKPECAKKIVQYNVKTIVFESNAAGTYFGRDVMAMVKEMGGRCSDRYKFNCQNKLTRMENARDNIIRHYYFLDKSKYDAKSQYGQFMRNLTTMTRTGKVKHDDAPDSLALMENEFRSKTSSVEVVRNPFRTGGYSYYY